MHILFAGGGTAGHINPAIAVAGYLKSRHPGAKISFVGTKSGMESELVPREGYDFYIVDVAGFQRKLNFTNLKRNFSAAAKLLGSSAQSKKLLQELAPDVAMGTGGYVSGPLLRKAAQMGIKTAIHEQNAFPGVTTKMLAPRVDAVMLAMPEAWRYLKPKSAFTDAFPGDYSYTENGCVITGNPVRESVMKMKKRDARQALGLDGRPMILSFGGSLGAKRLNETVAELLASHANSGKYYHYHAIGKYGMDWMPGLLHSKGVDYEINRVLNNKNLQNVPSYSSTTTRTTRPSALRQSSKA